MHEVTVYAVEDGKVKARIKRDPYADWKKAFEEDAQRGVLASRGAYSIQQSGAE